MNKISGNTLIPISMIGAIIGAAVWLTTIYNTAQANAEKIADIQFQRRMILIELREMNSRLSRIEGALRIDGRGKNK